MPKRRLVGAVAVAASLAVGSVAASAPPPNGPPSQETRQRGARRGRPRKFDRPSRAVTLTLPVETLAALRAIDTDISRAVVRVLEPVVAETRAPAELATFGDQAVILVPPSQHLRERLGVDFVPLSGSWALITFDEGQEISDFELRLRDELADATVDEGARPTFEAIAAILRAARRDDGSQLGRRSIIVLRRDSEVRRSGA